MSTQSSNFSSNNPSTSAAKTILITGTSSGFGRLSTLSLAREGHTVFATMRDSSGRNLAARSELEDIAGRVGRSVSGVRRLLARGLDRLGRRVPAPAAPAGESRGGAGGAS